MNRRGVGEDRGSKGMDRCPLTHWMCRFHMKTSQKAYCYLDPVKDGYFHPLTKGNLGYWTMLHVSLVCCCTHILI
jgi:hypothetical protein